MKPETLTADMTTLGASRTLDAPTLRKACVIRADIGPAMEFRTTQARPAPSSPSSAARPSVPVGAGRVVPGGADFALALPDGSYAIEARYCLELDDGTPVMVTNAGRMVGQPDGSFFGRTRAELEVPEGRHSHLGSAVYFGTALAEAGDDAHVYIELWEAPVLP